MKSEIGRFKLSSYPLCQGAEGYSRTRLIGLAALTGAITSEALYNDAAQFKIQVSIIMRPLLMTLLQADLSMLNEQSVFQIIHRMK